MSCMCRNMEKAGWLELWKGRLGCLGKVAVAMDGLGEGGACFSSRTQAGRKGCSAEVKEDGAMCQGSRLPAPLSCKSPCKRTCRVGNVPVVRSNHTLW